MPKGKHVSDEQKELILKQLKAGKSKEQTAKYFGLSKQTISRIIRKSNPKQLKLDFAKEALRMANRPTKIEEMPSTEKLEQQLRAIIVMLGLARTKEILQDIQQHII